MPHQIVPRSLLSAAMCFSTALNRSASCLRTFLLRAAVALTAMEVSAGEITNSIGIKMIDIPAGRFMMGSCLFTSAMEYRNEQRAFLGQAPRKINCTNADPDARPREAPQHEVNIAAFQLGKTEVTLGQFKQFIVATKRLDLVTDEFIASNAKHDNNEPVVVSLAAAIAFINWLNSIEGGGYRLPSESEWEYACRAGGNHRYCGSNDIDSVAWYGENSGGKLHPVGLKQPNAFGLYDMSGNVEEWVVETCGLNNYILAETDCSPNTGSIRQTGRLQSYRWIGARGGSAEDSASFARAASRSNEKRDRDKVGFRLAR